MHAERITDSVCYHGEGPVWTPSFDGLRWVDMLAGDMMHLRADGSVQRIPTPSPVVACIRPRRGGGAVLGVERGFALEDPDGTITLGDDLWDGPIRMNEGAVGPDGSFWCGSMAYDQAEGAASLWRLRPDGSTERSVDGLTVSNGLAFTADGTVAYYVDTPTGRVDVWDVDAAGTLHSRRPFADLTEEEGYPDGLCLDDEGRVWVAMNGASRVLGLGLRGEVVERIDVGARQVTACTFGGEDLATLFITTSRENLDPDDDPAAGSLFSVRPGAVGDGTAREFAA